MAAPNDFADPGENHERDGGILGLCTVLGVMRQEGIESRFTSLSG